MLSAGSHAVNVVGQHLVYSSGSPEPEMDLRWEASPSSCRPRGRAPVKAGRSTGGERYGIITLNNAYTHLLGIVEADASHRLE